MPLTKLKNQRNNPTDIKGGLNSGIFTVMTPGSSINVYVVGTKRQKKPQNFKTNAHTYCTLYRVGCGSGPEFPPPRLLHLREVLCGEVPGGAHTHRLL
jgi:hypothetical protein